LGNVPFKGGFFVIAIRKAGQFDKLNTERDSRVRGGNRDRGCPMREAQVSLLSHDCVNVFLEDPTAHSLDEHESRRPLARELLVFIGSDVSEGLSGGEDSGDGAEAYAFHFLSRGSHVSNGYDLPPFELVLLSGLVGLIDNRVNRIAGPGTARRIQVGETSGRDSFILTGLTKDFEEPAVVLCEQVHRKFENEGDPASAEVGLNEHFLVATDLAFRTFEHPGKGGDFSSDGIDCTGKKGFGFPEGIQVFVSGGGPPCGNIVTTACEIEHDR
jgi:hypothetical protein